jgi:mannose/fructose/N-acetylgalactosamine-specific phosphotransferase system component IID
MYIVVIAWLYVTTLMALAEATHAQGTLLGALLTFVFYGALPILLMVYLMRAAARRRAQQAATSHTQHSDQPNASSHAPADAVAPMRKEP